MSRITREDYGVILVYQLSESLQEKQRFIARDGIDEESEFSRNHIELHNNTWARNV